MNQKNPLGERAPLSRPVIASVHNILGRVAAAAGQTPRAHKHFAAAVAAGAPGSPSTLQTQARIARELEHMGLPGAAELQLVGAHAVKEYEGKISAVSNQ